MRFKHHIGAAPKLISELFQTNKNFTAMVFAAHM